jgi:universal stress protein A
MHAIKKILAPTDLSGTSRVGVRYALELAALFGAEIYIYHVVHYDEAAPYPLGLDEGASLHVPVIDIKAFLKNRHQALMRFLSDNFMDLTEDLAVHPQTDMGAASDKILEKAAEIGANLIVMSTHGRTGLGHMLIGSITEQVVRRSTCPVLSIRP